MKSQMRLQELRWEKWDSCMKTRFSVWWSSTRTKANTVLLSAIAPILAANFVFAGEAPPYVLIDSGFPSNEQYQPFWIDDDRVIFKGYEPGSYSQEMHRTESRQAYSRGYENGMRTGYYVWNTRTNKVDLYKDRIESFCVEDEKVVYQTIPSAVGEKAIVWRGGFGKEEPVDTSPAPPNTVSLYGNCWNIFPVRTDAQRGRRPIRLRSGWGYLDVGPSDPPYDLKAPVLYYREGQDKPLKLPIPIEKLINAGHARFVPHDGRHLVVEGLGDVSKVPDAWFLTPDGKLMEVLIPPGPWQNVTLYPVKGGIFLSSAYTKGKKLSDPAGAYLIPDGQWWRLLFTGVQGRAGVSLDGCKVALTVAPNEKAYQQSSTELKSGRVGEKTMRMINVCLGAKK